MERHLKSAHLGIKDVACTHEGCDKMFITNQHMLQHINGFHLSIRDVACTFEGCNQKFTQQAHLQRHLKAIHLRIRDVACTHEGCSQKFSSTGSMQVHVKGVHLGVRDVACTHEGCNEMFTTKQNMQRHYECWHTKDGQQRKVRKQHRMEQLLSKTYTVDSECHIRYAGGCVPDPDKFCSRVDMHIVGITRAITIVECDESGHGAYGLSCELSRMEQAHEGIIKAQFSDMVAAVGERKALVAPQKPVVFVRCNPDGRVVDGVKERVQREERDAQLLRVLAEIDSGELELPNPLNIVYVGYDMLDGEPVVCYDPAYAEQMRACVVLSV
jgi:hypothetical protein